MMKSYIKAISYYLPENDLTNDDLAREFPGYKIEDLTRLTGVRKRHISKDDETPGDLAVEAANKLFAQHAVKPEEIDYVLFCTQMGDYLTPATACIIQDRLGIPKHAGALDFNQGCTGYIYGLAIAKGLIEANIASNILLLTSEAITQLIHPEDKSNRAIFGDGAAATLISASEGKEKGIGEFLFGTDGQGYEAIIIKHGGARYPLQKVKSEDYTDQFGNVRNDACFYMNGSAVFTFSMEIVPGLITALLNKAGLGMDDIKLVVLHQANQVILESIFRKMKLPEEKTIIHLENCGNTVASTIPIALKKAIDDERVQPGDKVLLAGFGVGFSWAGTIIEI
ncbi:MAG: ketoacyl-ACP synthase III [Bacteroidota bacterium]|nr:ketoacyl-ACP synthase III [Bacteroidota bacterium]